jgi:hypothetical protein
MTVVGGRDAERMRSAASPGMSSNHADAAARHPPDAGMVALTLRPFRAAGRRLPLELFDEAASVVAVSSPSAASAETTSGSVRAAPMVAASDGDPVSHVAGGVISAGRDAARVACRGRQREPRAGRMSEHGGRRNVKRVEQSDDVVGIRPPSA